MATINKKFETKYSAIEMRHYVDTNILTNSTIRSLFNDVQWTGNTLYASSKLGKGTFTLHDNLIEINIDLNFLGGFAKKAIEQTIDKEFKQLNP